jgi:hypothetical protein
LVSTISQAENVGFVPSEMDMLVGKKILFKVMTSCGSCVAYDGSFRVMRVCIDETIIELFLTDGEVYTPSKVVALSRQLAFLFQILIYLIFNVSS